MKKLQVPDKVLLLYQAVIALIEDGMDVHSMKVIDITKKAGIGKGTAYEYFNSKEEIVSSALIYDMENSLLKIKGQMEKEEGFEAKLFSLFESMENGINERRGTQFFKLVSHSYEVKESLKLQWRNAVQDRKSIALLFEEILGQLKETGKKEGKIRRDIPDTWANMVLVSNLMSFFLFVNCEEVKKEATIQETKAFLCDTIKKSMQP